MNKKSEILRENVGVDISKDDFKAALSYLTSDLEVKIKASRSFSNTLKGIEEFEKWVVSKQQLSSCLSFTMEATGVYYESLAYYLFEKKYPVHVILPNLSKKYAQSLGIKSKTDKIDAALLGRLGLQRKLRPWEPFSVNLRNLKRLTRERDMYILDRSELKNQLHAFNTQADPSPHSIKRIKGLIEHFTLQIKEIESEIKGIITSDIELSDRLEYLLSIPGIGLLTAVIIVAETNGFASIENLKQLTSYAGLDIRIAQSGKWKGKSRISKKGNSHLRKCLYFPAFCKITHDKRTAEYYERLKARKSKSMIAVVAVQRKLLALCYTLWKKQEMYDPNIK